MEITGDGIKVTPIGYQGAAQHTYTPCCDGFHEAGPCPEREPLQEIVFSGGVTLPPRGWGGGTDGG